MTTKTQWGHYTPDGMDSRGMILTGEGLGKKSQQNVFRPVCMPNSWDQSEHKVSTIGIRAYIRSTCTAHGSRSQCLARSTRPG